MRTLTTITIATLLLGVVGCQTASPSGEEGPSSLFEAQHQAVSECGGFAEAAEYDSGGDYCAAEVLRWTFDAEVGSVALSDDRALLNCCGDHSVEAAVEDGVLVVTETDAPEGVGGRCSCMCVFDFSLTLDGVAAAPLALRIVRDVTDEGGPETILEGSLDLGEGSGEVLLSDEDAEMWCHPE